MKKDVALHLKKPEECFVPSLVEICPMVLEKNMKMWKVYGQTDRQTDGRSEKLTWTLSSGELKSDCNNTWSFYCEEKQCTQHPTIPYYGVTATYISHSHKFRYESV